MKSIPQRASQFGRSAEHCSANPLGCPSGALLRAPGVVAFARSQCPRSVDGRHLMGYSMRTDRYRFTRWVDSNDHPKVDAVELYDHQTDPEENVNIASDQANKALVEKLTARWQAGVKGAKVE